MNLIKENFNVDLPINSIFTQDWKDKLAGCDHVSFDNLDHFIYTVSKLKQKEDEKCGISYQHALNNLVQRKSDFPKEEQDSIRNLVRSNLFKRGLITREIYENYRYSTDGTHVGVDVAKYAAGEADCVIVPNRQYIDFFYELYVSISYSCDVTNEDVRKNVAKLLATVEELERQHIYVKIVAVLPISNPMNKIPKDSNKKNLFFSSIPIFSHKDFKSVDVMSSVINDRLLRKFYFAVLEDLYKENLHYGYGYPMSLNKAMNIGNTFDEIAFFENIKNTVGG